MSKQSLKSIYMNDILIVPDIHGRDFWRPALSYPGQIIFLGDYTDPYPSEGFTQENAYQNLLEIVELKKQTPDRVTLLIGNHELHYYNDEYASSRFSEKYYDKYHEILTNDDTASLFQVCTQVACYLFSHAGVLVGWVHQWQEVLAYTDKDTLSGQINDLFRYKMNAFYQISRHRGGWDRYGSPLWADLHEHAINPHDHDLFPNEEEYIQIFGHTQLRREQPFLRGDINMLDNRKLYLLRNHEIEEYKV
jgi:hypothetical protein